MGQRVQAQSTQARARRAEPMRPTIVFTQPQRDLPSFAVKVPHWFLAGANPPRDRGTRGVRAKAARAARGVHAAKSVAAPKKKGRKC